MTKFLKLALLLPLFIAGVTSCNNSNNDTPFYSYVTVQEKTGDNPLTFRRDAGGMLFVQRSSVSTGNLNAGDRLIVYFFKRGSSGSENGDLNIDLRGYSRVLTKDPVLQSFLDENPDEDAKLGSNAITADDAWFGGRYLNINFSILRNPGSDVRHFINLVADDVTFDGATMILNLRHNAYADLPAVTSRPVIHRSFVSFDMVNLLEGLDIESPEFKLVWYEYDGASWDEPLVKKELELGKFTPWTVERALNSIFESTDESIH